MVPFTVVEGPEAWTAAQYRDKSKEYVYVLSYADVAELDAAVAGVRDRDLKVRRASWEVAQQLPHAGPCDIILCAVHEL